MDQATREVVDALKRIGDALEGINGKLGKVIQKRVRTDGAMIDGKPAEYWVLVTESRDYVIK
jgi:hypothetical protein